MYFLKSSNTSLDAAAGLGDALLLGSGPYWRNLAGINGGIDQGSGYYAAGSYASLVFGGARLAYAGAVKGYSIVAPSGAAASAFRQSAKNWFRAGAGKNWRPPNLSKYSSDAALRAGAGRSNPYINAYGTGVVGAGAYDPH